MKIAVLGGSFNPIHNGHIALAKDVCSSLGYDRVIFVPSCISPHKQIQASVTSMQRLEMVRLACSADERFFAEDCEIVRGGISYTYDTISFLEKKYSGLLTDRIGLIIGRDLFSGFHLWHRAKELSEMCTLILAQRPHEDEDSQYSPKATGGYSLIDHGRDDSFDERNSAFFSGARILENPLLKISSTDIRRRIASGEEFAHLVPQQVFDYIVGGKLYGLV